MTAAEALTQATEHHRSGRLAEAETLYRQALELEPQNADALHLLGVISQQTGRPQLAEQFIRQAIALTPERVDFHCNLARLLLALNRVTEAGVEAQTARKLDPNSFDALLLFGCAALQLGESKHAAASFEKALSVNPESGEAHFYLGRAHMATGDFAGAIEQLTIAAKSLPKLPVLHNSLAIALASVSRFHEAAAAAENAIALEPSSAHYANRGVALAGACRWNEAIESFSRALAIEPEQPATLSNLGMTLVQAGRATEAEAVMRHCVSIDPTNSSSMNNFAAALRRVDKVDESLAAYERAILIAPTYAAAHNGLATLLQEIGEPKRSMEIYDHLKSAHPQFIDAASNRVYTMHFIPDFTAADLQRELADWNERFAKSPANLPPHQNKPDPNKRLRIGYVSPDLRDHVVGWNLLPLLKHHDKAQFEIFAYDTAGRNDAMTAKLAESCDHWRSLMGQTDSEAAQTIREDGIDLLVDLALHTSQNRLTMFAHKPAPVQLTYLGYCSSTGMPAIDYRLSDPYMDPPGTDLSVYAEQTVRLPATFWCYNPAESPEVSPLPFDSNRYITFGCQNNYGKVSIPALELWISIMKRLRRSHLVMYAPLGRFRENICKRFADAGIDNERIEFVGKQKRIDYFKTYNRIDIALDPFPYGGGITTCDALWMGVPVISLIGQTAVGRGGFSILSNVDLAKFACATKEDYATAALKLADDPAALATLRAELREWMRCSPLMDQQKFARDIEAAYRRMWQTWCERQ